MAFSGGALLRNAVEQKKAFSNLYVKGQCVVSRTLNFLKKMQGSSCEMLSHFLMHYSAIQLG